MNTPTGAQDGSTTVPAVTAPSEAIAVLASAFALYVTFPYRKGASNW